MMNTAVGLVGFVNCFLRIASLKIIDFSFRHPAVV